MFKKTALVFFSVLFLLGISITGCGEKKPVTEEDICLAVFQAMQSGDADSYSSLLITEETLADLLLSLDEASPKEKSIKNDLSSSFDVAEVISESLDSFQDIIQKTKPENGDLTQATYSGLLKSKTRYEAGNHQCKEIYFGMSVGEESYSVSVGVFQTENSIFVYDQIFWSKLVNYQFKLVTPKENPVKISAGSSLPVAITFDAEAVRKAGAWIQTVIDGKGGRMFYDSSMESPYTTEISGKQLTSGTHTVEFKLHPSGRNTDNPLDKVKLDIVVE